MLETTVLLLTFLWRILDRYGLSVRHLHDRMVIVTNASQAAHDDVRRLLGESFLPPAVFSLPAVIAMVVMVTVIVVVAFATALSLRGQWR